MTTLIFSPEPVEPKAPALYVTCVKCGETHEFTLQNELAVSRMVRFDRAGRSHYVCHKCRRNS